MRAARYLMVWWTRSCSESCWEENVHESIFWGMGTPKTEKRVSRIISCESTGDGIDILSQRGGERLTLILLWGLKRKASTTDRSPTGLAARLIMLDQFLSREKTTAWHAFQYSSLSHGTSGPASVIGVNKHWIRDRLVTKTRLRGGARFVRPRVSLGEDKVCN